MNGWIARSLKGRARAIHKIFTFFRVDSFVLLDIVMIAEYFVAPAYTFFITLFVFLLGFFGGFEFFAAGPVRKCHIHSLQLSSNIIFCLFLENNDYKTKKKKCAFHCFTALYLSIGGVGIPVFFHASASSVVNANFSRM